MSGYNVFARYYDDLTKNIGYRKKGDIMDCKLTADRQILLDNIDKLYTTELGICRIKKKSRIRY